LNREGAYNTATRGFSLLFAVVGLLMLVVTLANGGGPGSIGFVLGVLFLAVGIGRFWIATRSAR
jgi:hypothetical protein